MGFQTTEAYNPDHSSTLMSLPPEIREQIYTYLFANTTLTPSPPLTPTATNPLRTQPYTHPCLALLATSRLIHAEAYPHLVRAASLALRAPTDHVRLYTSSTQPAPSLQDQDQPQQRQRRKVELNDDSPYISKPDVLPNFDRCCRPALAEVQRLVLSWPLLCAWDRRGETESILGFGSYKSPPQAQSQAEALQNQQRRTMEQTTKMMMLPRLRELVLRDIVVGVVHARLGQLWTVRRTVGGCAGAVNGNANANGNCNGAAAAERGLLLVQSLMCQLQPNECDLLLGTLDAARDRWRVEMAWAVKCSTCGLLAGSEDEEHDWQLHRQQEVASMHRVGCPIGTVGVEVGIEV